MGMFVVRPLKIGAAIRNRVKNRLTTAAISRVVEPIFSQEMLDRFDRFSAGGGNWKKLAPATIKRKKSSRILYETGDFRKALDLGIRVTTQWQGSVLRMTGAMTATRIHKPSKMPMPKLLKIHQEGTNRIPARKVIVRPSPAASRKAMRAILAAQRNRR